jgi:zinc transport system substrate-binding protein
MVRPRTAWVKPLCRNVENDGAMSAGGSVRACGAAAVSLLVCACTAAPAAPRRVAAASIAPLADLVARVAGDSWTVRVIVPPGRSPHVFEPTPGEVRRIANASLIVTVGAGYDEWAASLARASASSAVLHDAGATVGITAWSRGAEEAEGVLGHDPHWWLSPPLAARALGPLAERFATLDPAGAAAYRARAAEARASLASLDGELSTLLAPVRGRAFLSAHAAWAYFADRYGLRAVGSIEPVPGREPSPRALVSLIHAAREERLATLFTEPQFPDSSARIVAREAGVAVRELDPIGGVEGRRTYEELLRFDARAFREGLAAERPRA